MRMQEAMAAHASGTTISTAGLAQRLNNDSSSGGPNGHRQSQDLPGLTVRPTLG